jgi:hypothetical protein
MAESGYDTLYEEAAGFDRPIFLSETGCQPNSSSSRKNRDFADQVAMLGRDMNDRYSGNIIYEWANQESDYGLVSYTNDAATGTPRLLADYTSLKSQWATLHPTGVKESAYNADGTKRACPTSTAGGWLVGKNAELPTLGTQGLTAPTGPRSTPRASGTGASGARESAASTGSSATGLNTNNAPGKSKTPVGAIAGGVLGGLVVLALLLGGILLLLRRKRKQRAETGTLPANQSKKTHQNGYYGPGSHDQQGLHPYELDGPEATHELDPARGQIAPMPAAELSEQRRLVEAGAVREEGTREREPEREGFLAQSEGGSATGNGSGVPAPSPFVQRQRDLEMEWLESEEQRLRERRELLRRQNGGDER